MTDGLGVFEEECLVIDPGAVAVDVDLGGDVEVVVFWIVEAELEGFFVVSGDEVGIGGFAGFDFRLMPRAALAAGFAEFPDVVDGASPERGLAVVGADDVGIGFSGFGRLVDDAAHDEKAAVGAEVVHEPVVGGDGAELGDSACIVGGQFVKRAVGVEQVALGGDFTGDACAPELRRVEDWISLRQTPALAFVVGENGGRGISC